MLKKLSTICLIVITININAQVINKPVKQRKTDPSNTERGNQNNSYNNQNNSNNNQNSPYNTEKKPIEFKRSLLQVNIFEFIFTNVAVSYEIFSKDGKSGFQIPFTFGIGGKPDNNPYPGNNQGLFIVSQNRIFESGLHYHYYFVGQRKASPFMGAGFNIGAFNYWGPWQSVTINNGSYPYTQQVPGDKQVGTNYAGSLFGGILINPNETITFSLKTGLGFMGRSTNISTTNYQDYTRPYGLLEINLGFKF
ncbi:MAG TPA: hypothetical protein VNX01_08455 [Bacteroidia bacterium]|nr:hypothetical protein [Bacteroidia bacterium]